MMALTSFSIIFPLALGSPPAVPIKLSCGLVTVDLDVEVDLSVVYLLHLKTI